MKDKFNFYFLKIKKRTNKLNLNYLQCEQLICLSDFFRDPDFPSHILRLAARECRLVRTYLWISIKFVPLSK